MDRVPRYLWEPNADGAVRRFPDTYPRQVRGFLGTAVHGTPFNAGDFHDFAGLPLSCHRGPAPQRLTLKELDLWTYLSFFSLRRWRLLLRQACRYADQSNEAH